MGLGSECPSQLWAWMTFGKLLSLFMFLISLWVVYKGAAVSDRCLCSALYFCCGELQFYFQSEVNWCWQINYQIDTFASLVYDKYLPTTPACILTLRSAAIKHVQARLYGGRKKKIVCKTIFSCTDDLISRVVFSSLLAFFLVWCSFGVIFL